MPPEANVESTLVWYEHTNPKNYKYWVDETANFLKCLFLIKYCMLSLFFNTILIIAAYEDLPKRHHVNCTFDNPPPPGKVCGIETHTFGPCVESKNFGYADGRPCIFLKLNKVELTI